MLIIENNKKFYFHISGYQFPTEKSSSEEYNHDANWLNCEIKYAENDFIQTCIDPCLLTSELNKLIYSLSQILDGVESGYISDFLEPYLQISIAKAEDKILFIFSFVYSNKNDIWKTWKVTSLVEKSYAVDILNELKEFQKLYPER